METQTITLSKVEETLTDWFQNGVTYTKGLFYDFLKVPEYDNLPQEAENALIKAQWKIIFNILKQKGIPPREWPGCLHSPPINPGRIPLPVLPPIFGLSVSYVPLPIIPIYNTEGLPPQERAQQIAKIWHDLTWKLWADEIIQNAKESTRALSGINLEKEIDKELRLRKAGLTDEALLILYAKREKFASGEIAELLSRGSEKPKTRGQIRTQLARLRQKEANLL